MGQISTGELRAGMKVEVDKEPYTVISNEFVKPGKGQPFNRIKIKHLLTGRVTEKTFRSGEKIDLADVEEKTMRLLYREADHFVFMDEKSFEQYSIAEKVLQGKEGFCKDDIEYGIVFYKGEVIEVIPPTFMELKVTETAPGLRGDTSGRALKPAILETGAKVQVPLFVEEGDVLKIDTRTGEYVSRV